MTKAMGKRIVVVLGMHRSGTSAVARGLKALGVELGEHLMPPAADNNEKGFFEDIDVNALNNEILKHLGHSWDSLGPIAAPALLREGLAEFRLRAVELLRDKLAGVTVFGMKDPRVSRLLPLWQAAFADVGAAACYVISNRHPLSVARSLAKRDAMDAGKSHYLWLDHVVDCLRDTDGAPRMVVDYDQLMARPGEQLERIAKAFDLRFDATSAGLAEYAGEFLTEGLRHSVFGLEDLKLLPDMPKEVVEAYSLLHRLARDEVSLDDPAVRAAFAGYRHRLDEMHPAFACINRRDAELTVLRKVAVERGERVGYLEHVVSVRDDHVALLEQEVAKRDGHIANLQQIVGDREGQLAGLRQVAVEREEEVTRLQELVATRDARIAVLEHETAHELELGRLRLADALRQVSRDEDRISRLKTTVMELQDLLARREAVIRERQAEVERLDRVLGQVGHRFVSRLGALLQPYPGLRSVIRAPLRALQWMVGNPSR